LTKNKFHKEIIVYETDLVENDAYKHYSAACIFLVAVTFLSSSCLGTILGYSQKHTNLYEEFTKYAPEMCRSAMAYVHTKFHRDWFRHSKVDNEYTGTQTARRSHSFIQNEGSKLHDQAIV
jgi:hypothetical protein